MDSFGIFNIIALGTLAGTITGLVIGWAAGRQKVPLAQMSRNDRLANAGLIILFSIAWCAGLAWYVFMYQP